MSMLLGIQPTDEARATPTYRHTNHSCPSLLTKRAAHLQASPPYMQVCMHFPFLTPATCAGSSFSAHREGRTSSGLTPALRALTISTTSSGPKVTDL